METNEILKIAGYVLLSLIAIAGGIIIFVKLFSEECPKDLDNDF